MFRALFKPSVKQKLLLLTGTVLVLLLLLVYSGWHGFRLVKAKTHITAVLEQQAANLQTILRGLAELSLTEGTPAPYRLTRNAIEKFEKNHREVIQMIRSDDIYRGLTEVVYPQWESFRGEMEAFLALGDVSPYHVESMVQYGRLSSLGEKLLGELDRIVQMEYSYADRVVRETLRAIGLLAMLILLVTGGLLFSVYRSVARPIGRIAELSRQAAKGDLTCCFELQQEDEIGTLAKAFGSMTESLKAVIARAQGLTGGISEVSRQVADASGAAVNNMALQKRAIDATARTIEGMDEFVASMNSGAAGMLASAEKASTTVTAISRSICRVEEQAAAFQQMQDSAASSVSRMINSVEQVDESVQRLSSVSGNTVNSLVKVEATIHDIEQKALKSVSVAEQVSRDADEKGMPAILAAVGGIEEIQRSVGALADVIHRLGQRSQQIGQLLTVIDEVADQTQLLSLNAAIIAAQAGQHGQAFSVVADEIKEFARKTTVSTREVADLINAIRRETRSSETMVEEGLEAVSKGLGLVEAASEIFRSIRGNSQLSTETAKAIQESTALQAHEIYQVTQATREMARHIEKISHATKEQTEGNRIVLESVDVARGMFENIMAAMEQQSQNGSLISRISEDVRLRSEQIKKDIENHKQRSGEVVEAIGSIHRTTRLLVDSAQQMNCSISDLKENTQSLEAELERFRV